MKLGKQERGPVAAQPLHLQFHYVLQYKGNGHSTPAFNLTQYFLFELIIDECEGVLALHTLTCQHRCIHGIKGFLRKLSRGL